ncbi:transposase [Bacillus suaedaesalsae]|uniref:Transposase n=1 Tax=Bacillus suaedaesalsae TaxID=2810349 RepID=A0ABS2DGU0_9BACI|nr:transposase [Bacillus suaedaesalsae]MBM6616766.1 transposase [Bacillus suaedaesalsae]
MPRSRRIWNPDMFYHVVSRGNRRDALYLDDRDFRVFLSILSKTMLDHPFDLASYCLMTNHYHLQLRTSTTSISTLMAIINKRYATYYNNRYRLTGHVFESRFFSDPIPNSFGILEVSRYIHLNPVRAKIAERPQDYPYSSFRYLIGEAKYPPYFLNSSILLSMFTGKEAEKKEKYRTYIHINTEVVREKYMLLEMNH